MRIVWGKGARRDFERAMAYLRAESPAGADRAGERILRAIQLLEHFPELAPPSEHRALRQLFVSRRPIS